MFRCLGQYEKAKDYLEKALAITIEIGGKEGEASLVVVFVLIIVILLFKFG